jgi:hypothetical protein
LWREQGVHTTAVAVLLVLAAFGPPLSTVDKSLYVVSDQVQNTLATCFNESCHGILV